ncbi:hypothetical protein CRT23_20535 [Methylobacterium sp. V23]|nr:hypothetical protein CRT23_20535 [Methylobacterium sp. V23]
MIAFADWREETRVVDAQADALIAGDGPAAARAVEGVTDQAACARIWGRAKLIVLWHSIGEKDWDGTSLEQVQISARVWASLRYIARFDPELRDPVSALRPGSAPVSLRG